MNTADGHYFSLRVSVGECERYTVANTKAPAEAEPKSAGRTIRLYNCAIVETNFEGGEERRTIDKQIEVWIDEFYAGVLDIGSFTSFENIRLRLPPSTFSHFWAA